MFSMWYDGGDFPDIFSVGRVEIFLICFLNGYCGVLWCAVVHYYGVIWWMVVLWWFYCA